MRLFFFVEKHTRTLHSIECASFEHMLRQDGISAVQLNKRTSNRRHAT